LLIATALAAAASPSLLLSQTVPVDTLPFRRGQWAAQFWAFSSQGLGVLRFRSPSSAWLLDGSLQVEDVHATHGDRTYASASLRAGLRVYRPVAPKVVRYLGAGLIGSYLGFRHESATIGTVYRGWTAGGGLYAELGADYLITSHLGIGASSSVTAQARGGRVDPGDGSGETGDLGWVLGAGGLRVVGTIYF
jgi:hypothetical protein